MSDKPELTSQDWERMNQMEKRQGLHLGSNSSPQQTGTPDLNERQTNIPGDYLHEVAEVIRKVRRGCLLPPMTPIELDPIVLDWAEVFYGIIPLGELNAAYLAAKQNPNRRPEDKKFPLKDTEILDAYYKQLAGAGPGASRCQYCDLYKYDSTEYPRCPFHGGSQQQITRGLKL